jgi:hypothetical protein
MSAKINLTTIGSTAAVIAIGGAVAANTIPIVGTIMALTGAGIAATALYRKLSTEAARAETDSKTEAPK